MCPASALLFHTNKSVHANMAQNRSIMRDCPAKANQGLRTMKKIGGKDRPRPLQMCLACSLARAITDGTSFDFHTNKSIGGAAGKFAG